MKKYYQFFGLVLIMVFSFYYTEQIATIVLNKNPLMQMIKEEARNYNVSSVNALIDGNYIVPGLKGLEVNLRDSFYNMKESNVFSEYFLVFDEVKPEISLNDNKDKIIRQGNYKKKMVSLILESEGEISEYLKSKNIKASLLSNLSNYVANGYFEAINNEVSGFKSLENSLNLNKENKNICILNDNNKDICLKNNKYLVDPGLKLNSSNIIDVKNNILSGSIILIKNSAKLSDIMLILKEINYKDLEIVFLSDLIKEDNS